MENDIMNTRKEEETKYFANLTNMAHSGNILNVEINSYNSEQYINYLKDHPEDLKLTFAYLNKDHLPSSSCSIIVCRDKNEFEHVFHTGEDWLVTKIWKENREITITNHLIAIEENSVN